MKNTPKNIRRLIQAQYDCAMSVYDGFVKDGNVDAAQRVFREAMVYNAVLLYFDKPEYFSQVADIYELT